MGSLKHMKIRTKFASLIALNVVILGAVAHYSVREIGSVRRQIEAIAEHDLPLANALGRIAQEQIRVGLQLERVLRLAEIGAGADREAAFASAREALADLVRQEDEDLQAGERLLRHVSEEPSDPEEAAEFAKALPEFQGIERRFADYRREAARVIGLIDARRLDEATAAVPRLIEQEATLEHGRSRLGG